MHQRWSLILGATCMLGATLGCDTLMTSAPTAGDEFAAPVDGDCYLR